MKGLWPAEWEEVMTATSPPCTSATLLIHCRARRGVMDPTVSPLIHLLKP